MSASILNRGDLIPVWRETPGDKISAPLSTWRQYVISHRPRCFTACYRPFNRHVFLAQRETLDEAKRVVEDHALALVPATDAFDLAGQLFMFH
jgi:hypothetical protein